MMPFHKKIKCQFCPNEFHVVGTTDESVTMSTREDGAIATNVFVGYLQTTEGPKEDIKFDAYCPECNSKNESNVLR